MYKAVSFLKMFYFFRTLTCRDSLTPEFFFLFFTSARVLTSNVLPYRTKSAQGRKSVRRRLPTPYETTNRLVLALELNNTPH